MISGVLNPEKIWHQQLVHLPTLPVYCSHFILGNPEKSFFSRIIHTYEGGHFWDTVYTCSAFTDLWGLCSWYTYPVYLLKYALA